MASWLSQSLLKQYVSRPFLLMNVRMVPFARSVWLVQIRLLSGLPEIFSLLI